MYGAAKMSINFHYYMHIIVIAIGMTQEVWGANPCPEDNLYADGQPDGCSSWNDNPKLVKDRWGPVDFTSACNKHDICYYTLGTTAAKCNHNFRNDLYETCRVALRVCTEKNGKQICTPTDPGLYKKCFSVATAAYVVVQGVAWHGAYDKAQDKQRKHENKCRSENLKK